MITASHNAPRYNGLKLKAAYGGSALPDQCRQVELFLADNEARARGPNLMDYDRAVAEGLITRFNPTAAYAEHLRTLIDFDMIASRPQRLVVDSMYGSGRGVIKGLLHGTRRRGHRDSRRDEPRLRRHPPRAHRPLPGRHRRRHCGRPRRPGAWSPTATPTASARWTGAASSWTRTRSWRWR